MFRFILTNVKNSETVLNIYNIANKQMALLIDRDIDIHRLQTTDVNGTLLSVWRDGSIGYLTLQILPCFNDFHRENK